MKIAFPLLQRNALQFEHKSLRISESDTICNLLGETEKKGGGGGGGGKKRKGRENEQENRKKRRKLNEKKRKRLIVE